ncbi:ATPase [Acidipropionibacterium jensenii]|uniref:ATPase n=1 Tax=Acidipropionibacterium jensenii TaxID=1749 RepID=A0A3T0S2L8_9ACTN|nr:BadF/BadG/BcrA/BcrD ATPase family protein [Acidipropionibacterium jensenii]AZZ40582.1 ATPase [Acidipropionibacterium jensenii]
MSELLAIDCGQSGSRARLMSAGRTVSETEYGPVFTQSALEPQLAELIGRAAGDLPEGTENLTVAVGSSGWSDDAEPAEVGRLVDSDRVSEVILAHDSVTSYLGALGQNAEGGASDVSLGAVVASGTGVVTLGVGEHRVARVDGWGYLFGDAGSGFWIGRAAIDAVLRAYDGRGPRTALTERVTSEFPDLSTLYLQVQADPGKVSRVARYARITAELAAEDPVAAGICRDAGHTLADSVLAALRVVGLTEQSATRTPAPAVTRAVGTPSVARVGKVFGSEVVRQAFDEHLTRTVPGVRIVEHPGTALDGAGRLAGLPVTSALYPAVRRVGIRPITG